MLMFFKTPLLSEYFKYAVQTSENILTEYKNRFLHTDSQDSGCVKNLPYGFYFSAAFEDMLENPLNSTQWMNDPETGPVMLQISRIFQTLNRT